MSDGRLTPTEIASLLLTGAAQLAAELRALPERVVTFHPAPGEWCAKEVLGHLIEAERRGFAGRIRQVLESQNPLLQAWDADTVARERRDCARPLEALLAEFTSLRAESARLVQRLRDADLARAGRHPKVGDLSVSDIVQEWVHHDRNHIRQALANVQAFVWPAMGNARKFSALAP